MGDVWSELIGQQRAVETLRRAVDGRRHAMTHAWLFVGPPGSGRSNAAKAFAAALQCARGGCGHARPNSVQSRTAIHGVGGSGAFQRRSPTGGAAKGIPR